MKDGTVEMAERVLSSRGFKEDDNPSINLIQTRRSFGDNRDLMVWGRVWSGLKVQIVNPEDYESGFAICETEDEATFTRAIDLTIEYLQALTELEKAEPIG